MTNHSEADPLILELVRDVLCEVAPDEVETFDLVGRSELGALGKGAAILDDPMMGDTADLVMGALLWMVEPAIRNVVSRHAIRSRAQVASLALVHLRSALEELHRTEPAGSRKLLAAEAACRHLERWSQTRPADH